MKNQQIILLFFLILISCKSENKYQKQIKLQVENIKTIEDKKSFLDQIFEESEGISSKIKTLEKNFINNKSEIKILKNKKDSLVIINRYRANEYLNKFSYPVDSIFSKNERKALYYAVYYDFKEAEQLKYIDIFNNLYRSGQLDKFSYLDLLIRIYYLSENNFYKLNKNQSIEEMIDDIYPVLMELKK